MRRPWPTRDCRAMEKYTEFEKEVLRKTSRCARVCVYERERERRSERMDGENYRMKRFTTFALQYILLG
jgi:hypothetical protein